MAQQGGPFSRNVLAAGPKKASLPDYPAELNAKARGRCRAVAPGSTHARSQPYSRSAECPHQVDMSKVNLEVLKPWIEARITELLGGVEDEVLVGAFANTAVLHHLTVLR
jgi:hypothetical protein